MSQHNRLPAGFFASYPQDYEFRRDSASLPPETVIPMLRALCPGATIGGVAVENLTHDQEDPSTDILAVWPNRGFILTRSSETGETAIGLKDGEFAVYRRVRA